MFLSGTIDPSNPLFATFLSATNGGELWLKINEYYRGTATLAHMGLAVQTLANFSFLLDLAESISRAQGLTASFVSSFGATIDPNKLVLVSLLFKMQEKQRDQVTARIYENGALDKSDFNNMLTVLQLMQLTDQVSTSPDQGGSTPTNIITASTEISFAHAQKHFRDFNLKVEDEYVFNNSKRAEFTFVVIVRSFSCKNYDGNDKFSLKLYGVDRSLKTSFRCKLLGLI
jgi:hypothetical protein